MIIAIFDSSFAREIWQIRSSKEWHHALASTSQPRPSLTHVPIPPIHSTSVLCFTDAAWHATSSRAGCGWIFISQQDEHLHQGTTTFENTSSSLVPEALTIRSALLNALEAGFTRICIKKNCQALVALINSKNHPKDLYRIYRDIEHLSLSFYRIAFSYVSRNLNSLADSLAKSALLLYQMI
ncbi:hypothetical protein BRARA_G01017 [Brassica rapa]|uniref:RNase H type-1 domain-containing protein n=1 Tax=Brassica campestris TaxID=3711 RepID=A0A397YJM0_BRACM|nr:hypothetical protein BRARA_G01017 [Brassica rapa]